MKDPDIHNINDVIEDLSIAFDEENNEQLTELELEELMEALDTPGL